MDYRSYIRCETLKLLKKNLKNTFQDMGIGNGFLNRTPTAQKIKQKLTNGIPTNKTLHSKRMK
jgi:hypothetical protein